MALGADHQVGALDIAMNNALAVGRLEPLRGLAGDVERFVELQRAFLEFLLDGSAFEEGHRQEGLSVDLVDLVDGADIRVIERRGGLGFAEKTLAMLGVFDDVGAKKLQRDRAPELQVLGLVDDAHSAFTELFGDAVMRNGFTDHRHEDCTAGEAPSGTRRIHDAAMKTGAGVLLGCGT